MQNKKAAAVSPLGILLIGFVGIIIGLALFQSIASYSASTSQTKTIGNTSYTGKAAGSFTDITNCQELIGSYQVLNATDSATIGTNNISLVERVGDSGLKAVSISFNDGVWSGRTVNVSAVCGEDGYIEDSGARSVTSLIVIMTALAIAGVGLFIAAKNGYFDFG